MPKRKAQREKRNSEIKSLLAQDPRTPDREIALAVGCSGKTVQRVRAKLEALKEVPHTDERIVNGVSRKLPSRCERREPRKRSERDNHAPSIPPIQQAAIRPFSFAHPNPQEPTKGEQDYKAMVKSILKGKSVPANEMYRVFSQHLRERYGDEVAERYLSLVTSPNYHKAKPSARRIAGRRTAKVFSSFFSQDLPFYA